MFFAVRRRPSCRPAVCAGKLSSESPNYGLDRQTFQPSVANASAAASQPSARGSEAGDTLQKVTAEQKKNRKPEPQSPGPEL